MTPPKIDLLALWDEAFEMNQEKSALYGEPHSQSNPYTPPTFPGDQTYQAGCLDELQEPAQGAPDREPIDELVTPF